MRSRNAEPVLIKFHTRIYLVLPCSPIRVAWSRLEATSVFLSAKKKAEANSGSFGRTRSNSRGTESGLRGGEERVSVRKSERV